jgi:hypothetical protein
MCFNLHQNLAVVEATINLKTTLHVSYLERYWIIKHFTSPAYEGVIGNCKYLLTLHITQHVTINTRGLHTNCTHQNFHRICSRVQTAV